jgi:hypothetical protein
MYAASVTTTGFLYIPVNYWLILIALIFGIMAGVIVGRASAFYEIFKFSNERVVYLPIDSKVE